MALSPGTCLGPYEIQAPIGAGGMGEVYRARDPRLGRDVAIKVLPEHLSRDAQRLARFEREVRAVAALSHPNILAIFDVGTERGISYSVTELLEGETLRLRLRRGAIAWRKAAEIAAALADGLAAAHAKGIVHRDLKPDNIFLTSDNRVKILDFGVAQFRPAGLPGEETLTQGLTEEGMVLGTLGYMSPEQVRGAVVSPGSDLFALGCVLYEMISGRRAFGGKTSAETVSAILRDSPAELTLAGVHVPPELNRLIAHSLEKEIEERFQSARDLAYDLRSLLGSTAAPAQAQAPAKAVNSIAVLPFVNASRDAEGEYLCDGITESIINTFTQIANLRVTPRSTVFRYKGKEFDPQAAGRELNARVVLTGRVIQRGEALVVSTELIDVAEGSQLWGERYNRKLSDIFALEEEIARKISESLRMKLTGEEKQRLVKRFTENSEAYQLYLKGRHYWLKRTPASMNQGIVYFQEAINKDPGYALAYAGLADCHSILAVYGAVHPREGFARAKAAAAATLALDPELAEGHASFAFIRAFADWDWVASEEECRRAIELNPVHWIAPYWYAVLLGITGRYEEAERQIARALELEPLATTIMHIAAVIAISARRYEDGIDRCLKGLEIEPDYPLLRLWLGLSYAAQSRYEEAIREIQRAVQVMGHMPMVEGVLGNIQAAAGNETEARGMLGELLGKVEREYVDPYAVALIFIGLGEQDQALEWLEKSCDGRSGWLTLWARGDPRLDALRPHPRFQKILKRMGLTQ